MLLVRANACLKQDTISNAGGDLACLHHYQSAARRVQFVLLINKDIEATTMLSCVMPTLTQEFLVNVTR